MKKFLLACLVSLIAPLAGLAQGSILEAPPPDTSLAALQERTSTRILNLSRAGYDQLVRLQREGIQLVWKNRDGLTPQQVCDGLGTKAAKVFAVHAALTDALVAAQTADGIPVNVATPTHAFTVNEDGTVTIGVSLEVPLSP